MLSKFSHFLKSSSAAYIAIMVFAVGCGVKEEPGFAEIKVMSPNGKAEGIDVTIYCTEPNCRIPIATNFEANGIVSDTTIKTNKEGVATFEFKEPAVLAVYAEGIFSTVKDIGQPGFPQFVTVYDTLCGEGFVTIAKGEIAEEVIELGECIQ